jgi:WD40 repeat protein
VWDADTGKEIHILGEHSDEVWSASFSPDGSRVVTAAWDNTARVWDAATGKLLLIVDAHTGWLSSASFSPDGSRLVTASWDGTARLWEMGVETSSRSEVSNFVRDHIPLRFEESRLVRN